MEEHSNVSVASHGRLKGLIAEQSNECVLRVRHGCSWWDGSNRSTLGSTGDSPRSPAFRTASITKTFTAALVLFLVEEGRLSLDASLSTYLPIEVCQRIHVFKGTSYGPRITVAQLLRHRSGVFDYATSPRFFEHVARNPRQKWRPMDLLNEAILSGGPYFRPDEGFAYSDTGYVLLAMILEAVTGASLATLYRNRLLDPLRLEHTYLEGCEPSVDWPVSQAFAGAVDTSALDPSFDTFGGGGLVSTAADLDQFISRLMSGSIFSKKETLSAMMEGTEAPAGIGTRKIRSAAGLSAFSVADIVVWGHLGHWNSFMLHSIEQDLSVCGTFNQADEDPRQRRVLEAAVNEGLTWQRYALA